MIGVGDIFYCYGELNECPVYNNAPHMHADYD